MHLPWTGAHVKDAIAEEVGVGTLGLMKCEGEGVTKGVSFRDTKGDTLLETNSSPLKMDGWKMYFLLKQKKALF